MATHDFSNAIPYAPTHVGELINGELVASGLSVEQLSEKANIELISLNEINYSVKSIIDEQNHIDAGSAIQYFAKYINVTTPIMAQQSLI